MSSPADRDPHEEPAAEPLAWLAPTRLRAGRRRHTRRRAVLFGLGLLLLAVVASLLLLPAPRRTAVLPPARPQQPKSPPSPPPALPAPARPASPMPEPPPPVPQAQPIPQTQVSPPPASPEPGPVATPEVSPPAASPTPSQAEEAAPAAPPAPPPPPPASADNGNDVSVWFPETAADQQQALALAVDLQRRLGTVLGTHRLTWRRFKSGDAIGYRLRIGHLDRAEADRLCNSIKEKGGACEIGGD